MIIKTPKIYISEADAIKSAGKQIKKFSENPLIIGSPKALDVTLSDLKKTLAEHDVSAEHTEIFSGFPSENNFHHYAELAREFHSDALIAAGGGRVLDTVKAVGDLLDIPVITIPTIAATCAAWAGLTVQYDDEGSYVCMRPLKKAPELVIADTKIILSAPERYLFAGVVDTFAKFYEIRPGLAHEKNAVNLDIAFYASKKAYKKLEENVFKAIYDAANDRYGQAAKDVVDAIIYLAGFAGSFQTDTGYYSFAHPFYHISSRFPETRHKLHGEKVAYGIFVQLFLEKKAKEEIEDVINVFEKYNNVFTLNDIGLNRENREQLHTLAADIKDSFDYVGWSEDAIVEALEETDRLVTERRKRG